MTLSLHARDPSPPLLRRSPYLTKSSARRLWHPPHRSDLAFSRLGQYQQRPAAFALRIAQDVGGRSPEAAPPPAKPPEERYWSTATRAMPLAGRSLSYAQGEEKKESPGRGLNDPGRVWDWVLGLWGVGGRPGPKPPGHPKFFASCLPGSTARCCSFRRGRAWPRLRGPGLRHPLPRRRPRCP